MKQKKRSSRLEKKHYRIIIGLTIFAVVYYYFIEPKTIGNDIRYQVYIFWLPTILGVILLAIYRRTFLLKQFAANKGFVMWAAMTFFYLLQGFLFSYLSFGQVAKMSWDYLNYQTGNQNLSEQVTCNVTRFWAKRRPYSFDFEFNGESESFRVPYRDVKPYRDKDPKLYELEIKVRKGLWNYYLVDSWRVLEK